MGEVKLKKDSLITKIIMVLLASLLITFITINVFSVKIVQNEVLNQIKKDTESKFQLQTAIRTSLDANLVIEIQDVTDELTNQSASPEMQNHNCESVLPVFPAQSTVPHTFSLQSDAAPPLRYPQGFSPFWD